MFKIFGKHCGTERFFTLLLIMSLGIVGIFGWAVSIQHERNKFTVGNQALYGTWFSWSRTSASGQIVKFVADSSNTACFLLIKNDDVSLTSTNADDYQVFLTGTDEPLTNNPTMTVYTFGLTGYVGFYFKDSRGFANQRYTVTLRADSAGSKMADESMWNKSVADQSFRDHNQTRFILNFGASGIERLPVMDDPGLTPMKIMSDLDLNLSSLGAEATGSSFWSLSSNAQGQLEAMSKSLLSIAQYRATLAENGVIVPDLPYYIAEDSVNTAPNDFEKEPMVFDPSMLANGGSGSSGTRFTGVGTMQSTTNLTESEGTASPGTGATWTDSNGNEHAYMYLHTQYLYPGTAQVCWQGKRMSDGFISQTRFYDGGAQGLDEAYADYAQWCKECVDDYSSDMPSSVSYSTWRMADGTYVDMSKTQGTAGQIPGMINRYVAEVNNYMKAKRSYLAYINSMLETEAGIQTLRKTIYSNNGSAAQNLWLY